MNLDENALKVIEGMGRQLGNTLVHEAMTTSQDDTHLTVQIAVIRQSAIFILATELYNRIAQFDDTFEKYLKNFREDLVKELKYLEDDTKDGQMEFGFVGKKQ